MSVMPEEAARRGRRMFLLVALAFFGPLLLAVLMYLGGGWSSGRTTQHGELLSPPPLLPDLALPATSGTNIAPRLRGKWTVLYVGTGACPADCQAALAATRQVRRALGKEMARVQRVFVAPDAAPDAGFIAREHPGLAIAGGAPAAAIVQVLGAAAPGYIFVADPLGNVVLRYPPTATMKDLYEDLQKLLKASGVG
jgi:hypothetical protein